MDTETKEKIKHIARTSMSHNPFFNYAVEELLNDKNNMTTEEKTQISAKLAQTYEQHLRNQMAYRTAKTRKINDKKLDKVFKKN